MKTANFLKLFQENSLPRASISSDDIVRNDETSACQSSKQVRFGNNRSYCHGRANTACSLLIGRNERLHGINTNGTRVHWLGTNCAIVAFRRRFSTEPIFPLAAPCFGKHCKHMKVITRSFRFVFAFRLSVTGSPVSLVASARRACESGRTSIRAEVDVRT